MCTGRQSGTVAAAEIIKNPYFMVIANQAPYQGCPKESGSTSY
jgi:hypothetical protein